MQKYKNFQYIDDVVYPIMKSENGCCFHRIEQPFRALGISPQLNANWKGQQQQFLAERDKQRATGTQQPFNVCYSYLHALMDPNVKPEILAKVEEYLRSIKIVTFSRDAGIPFDKLLEFRERFDFRIVVDFDDYWVLNKDHILNDFWKKENLEDRFADILREADAVTTTTSRLAAKIRTLNPYVYVLPNALELRRRVENVDWSRIRFGYVAGVTHLPDLETIEPVFRRVKDFPFTLMGYDNPLRDTMQAHKNRFGRYPTLPTGHNWDMAHNEWDAMVELCSNRNRNKEFRVINTKTLQHYMQHYDEIQVAIAPLAENDFNANKSSLKAYEAAAMGCALICSKVPPFTDDLPEGAVTFCSTSQEWITAIEKHKDPAYAQSMAQKLQDWFLQNRTFDVINMQRLEAYDEIIARPRKLVLEPLQYAMR